MKKRKPEHTPEPKPQIPTMLNALRKQREAIRTLVETLETKLGPVLRPAEPRAPVAVPTLANAAPVAETLNETSAVLADVNARLRDLVARVEV